MTPETIAKVLHLRAVNLRFPVIAKRLGLREKTVRELLCGNSEGVALLRAACKTQGDRVAFNIYMERRHDT